MSATAPASAAQCDIRSTATGPSVQVARCARRCGCSPGSKCPSAFTKSARPAVSTQPTRSSDDCTESDNDHHSHPDAHFDRRPRHRSAVLLQPVRRFRDLHRDQQIRVYYCESKLFDEYFLKYSDVEHAKTLRRDTPPLVARGAASARGGAGIEIVSIADVPAGPVSAPP